MSQEVDQVITRDRNCSHCWSKLHSFKFGGDVLAPRHHRVAALNRCCRTQTQDLLRMQRNISDCSTVLCVACILEIWRWGDEEKQCGGSVIFIFMLCAYRF